MNWGEKVLIDAKRFLLCHILYMKSLIKYVLKYAKCCFDVAWCVLGLAMCSCLTWDIRVLRIPNKHLVFFYFLRLQPDAVPCSSMSCVSWAFPVLYIRLWGLVRWERGAEGLGEHSRIGLHPGNRGRDCLWIKWWRNKPFLLKQMSVADERSVRSFHGALQCHKSRGSIELHSAGSSAILCAAE